MIKQEIPSGQLSMLTIQIAKVDKSVKSLKSIQMECILALNYSHQGDKFYKVENLAINWQ